MSDSSRFLQLLVVIFVLYRIGCFILWHLFKKCPVCRQERQIPLRFYSHNISFFWCPGCGILAYHNIRGLLFSTGSISVVGYRTGKGDPLEFLLGINGKVGVSVETPTIDIYILSSGSDTNDYSEKNIFVSTRSACTQGDGSHPSLYKTLGLLTRTGKDYYAIWY